MWKGKWKPCVYHYSSNWKELSTLRLTLLQIRDSGKSVDGMTVFYFTDNSTTYWISCAGSSGSPTLHSVIESIRTLEFELGCKLQVVHVPGYIIIQQGTDGLSRGVWMSLYHSLQDEDALLTGLFAPLPFDPLLVNDYIALIPDKGLLAPGRQWEYFHWQSPWQSSRLLGRCSVFFPPPEAARQVLTFFLSAYCELPLTTSGLFFIPRIVQAFWWGISRHIRELGVIYPQITRLRYPPAVPIPVMVLYVPPHQRSLPPPPRLDLVPLTRSQRHHLDEASRVGRLSPRFVDGSVCPDV